MEPIRLMDFSAKKLIKLGFFAGIGYTLWKAFAWASMALFTMIFLSCMATPAPAPEVVFTVGGENVAQVIDGTQEHPCEGNWNFCDQVMRQEKLVIPGEYDEYGSYVYPEFSYEK